MSNGPVFHIGDKVVYPNHGVGVVEQIASLTVGTQVEKFYVLSIAASNLKVRIPFHNVGNVGIRPSFATAKCRRSSNIFLLENASARPTGKTVSRKIPTACAPARSPTWPLS